MVTISRGFSQKLLCLAVASACAGPVSAGPAGFAVSAGSAGYAPATLTVTSTTERTQVSWQSFNVAAGEVVRFVQPSAQSAVLNFIVNPQSLNIFGGLNSNGSVLFTSNGRIFGSGVNLDLAGALDTSLRLPRVALAQSGPAPVAPTELLTTIADGRIYVIGEDRQAVSMAGSDVLLNPGKTIELANASMPHLRVGLSAPRAEAINLSRLVARKGDAGIFAGLVRVPAAARQAAEREAEVILTAEASERAPNAADIERFYRYALLYAQLRSNQQRDGGGMMKVAALTDGRMILPAARSRSSLLPREIEIGAPRPQELALRSSSPPLSVDSERAAAALEARSVAIEAERKLQDDGATLLAFAAAEPPAEMVATRRMQPTTLAFVAAEPPAESIATRSVQPMTLVFAAAEPPVEFVAMRSAHTTMLAAAEPPADMAAMRIAQPTVLAFSAAEPPAEMVATRSPQPTMLAFASAEPPAEMTAMRRAQPTALAFAAAEPPAEMVATEVSRADYAGEGSRLKAESANLRRALRSAPAVIVVALAQHAGGAAPQQDAPVKEVLIERRAPRYFTDYRGAVFFM